MDTKYLNECLQIDPSCPSGLRWKKRPLHHFKNKQGHKYFQTRYEGKPAGTILTRETGSQKWTLTISGKTLAVHRIVFQITHGYEPPSEIDHINHNPLDNTPSNLRLATRQQNARNRTHNKDNKLQCKGVRFRQGSFIAEANFQGKMKHLGCYKTIQEAKTAFNNFVSTIHQEFFCP
jgi:hypothetical protein